jgi:hypothetical protein
MIAVAISPKFLSNIIGAGQIGDPLIEVKEYGENGEFEIGQIVSLDAAGKVVKTVGANVASVYGVIAEERVIVDLNSERYTHAQVIRRASLKADELVIGDAALLRQLAPVMRNLGLYLEGLEATLAAPFRLRSIDPTFAEVNATGVRIDVYVDGSMDDSTVIWFGNTELTNTVVLDFSHAWAQTNMPTAVQTIAVTVRQGPWTSNPILFGVLPGVVPPPAPPRKEKYPSHT